MDKASIFRTAWQIARQEVAKVGGSVRKVFGAALRTAWAKAKNPAPVVADKSIFAKLETLANVIVFWPSNLRKTFSYRFIADNADRMIKYGKSTKFSDKQIVIINDLYAKHG